MALSRKWAQRFRHDHISPERIFLGLIAAGPSVAVKALEKLGVEVDRIRAEFEKSVKRGPSMATMGRSPFTPVAMRVLELSTEDANELGHT
jgi:ATP-dependent Clp protease ATP-binding subunit ClpC